MTKGQFLNSIAKPSTGIMSKNMKKTRITSTEVINIILNSNSKCKQKEQVSK